MSFLPLNRIQTAAERSTLFTGNIYYVDAAAADDTGAATNPTNAKKQSVQHLVYA